MKVNDLKNTILISSDKDIIKFVDEKFRRSKTVHNHKNIINTLYKLDEVTIKSGIARMKGLEESYDISKVLPSVTTFLLAVLVAYVGYFGKLFSVVIPLELFNALIIIAFFGFTSVLASKSKISRSTAIYFRSLLEDVLKSKQ